MCADSFLPLISWRPSKPAQLTTLHSVGQGLTTVWLQDTYSNPRITKERNTRALHMNVVSEQTGGWWKSWGVGTGSAPSRMMWTRTRMCIKKPGTRKCDCRLPSYPHLTAEVAKHHLQINSWQPNLKNVCTLKPTWITTTLYCIISCLLKERTNTQKWNKLNIRQKAQYNEYRITGFETFKQSCLNVQTRKYSTDTDSSVGIANCNRIKSLRQTCSVC